MNVDKLNSLVDTMFSGMFTTKNNGHSSLFIFWWKRLDTATNTDLVKFYSPNNKRTLLYDVNEDV